MSWAPAPRYATSRTFGFSTLTTLHAKGDSGTVCRELGIPVQPLGRVCMDERPKPSNQEMDGCSHCSAPVSISVLPSLAFTTARWAQGDGHLAPGSRERVGSIPHPSGQIKEPAAARGTCPRPRQEQSPAPIVPRENNAAAPAPSRDASGRPNVNRALTQGPEEEAVLRAWQPRQPG